MKSRQFCSVCKQWLDMEVVPTGDGDDDGVIWFRCPQCQGFLPKLSSAVSEGRTTLPVDGSAGQAAAGTLRPVLPNEDDDEAPDQDAVTAGSGAGGGAVPDDDADQDDDLDADDDGDGDDEAAISGSMPSPADATPAEPVHEYAAMLAAVDPAEAVPYRPWASFAIGQCVLHQAWNDCGLVVAKEVLPGGRQVIKCWFQGAGVVRLIENAPQ